MSKGAGRSAGRSWRRSNRRGEEVKEGECMWEAGGPVHTHLLQRPGVGEDLPVAQSQIRWGTGGVADDCHMRRPSFFLSRRLKLEQSHVLYMVWALASSAGGPAAAAGPACISDNLAPTGLDAMHCLTKLIVGSSPRHHRYLNLPIRHRPCHWHIRIASLPTLAHDALGTRHPVPRRALRNLKSEALRGLRTSQLRPVLPACCPSSNLRDSGFSGLLDTAAQTQTISVAESLRQAQLRCCFFCPLTPTRTSC